ncbi:YtfJ family protein [Pseudocitrobacter cyperus]|uniref:YtfJ family protein n=1 Tax=Pseudocitrobacter cyperus TaxID=3112843 RepID=A0ABV0HNR2_9ENTR
MTGYRWRYAHILALVATLLFFSGSATAHNFVVGKAVSPIAVSDGGELLLSEDGSIVYHRWNSAQFAGKVRIVQYIAGRKSAKKKNSLLIKAVEKADFPVSGFQPTTIVNTDDAIFGSGYFVRGKIEKNKRRYPWAQFIIDAEGLGRKTWRLPEESSTIFVLNQNGQIVWAKDGALTEKEVDTVIALVWKLLAGYDKPDRIENSVVFSD